jgi:hypothetical protein
MSARVDWQGTDRVVIQGMRRYEERVIQAIHAVADHFSAVIESEAKANAVWVDRTGAARQTLSGFKIELAKEIVAIYLAGGVDYQIFLELKNQGRYAIILPTLEQNYAPITQMLRDIFS